MRIDPNMYSHVDAAIQKSEQSLQTAMNQLSSGKSVSLPSDNPTAFAQDLQSVATSGVVDTYTKNADSVISQAQLADSVLSSVTTSLTQAISLGVEAGGSQITTAQRGSLVTQVQGLLSSVVSQANTTSNGVALFGGTAAVTTPFVADASSPNGYTYQGNSDRNQSAVGDGLQVAVNVPGDSVFTNPSGSVLGSLQQLISAMQTGSDGTIADATAAVTDAISQVGQVRAQYGGTVDQLNAQNDFLAQETVSLSSQQTSLTGVDLATAATNLTQAQTANSAVLAMAAKILPQSLLTYLH